MGIEGLGFYQPQYQYDLIQVAENKDAVNKVTSIVNKKADKQKRINSYKRIREANIFKKFR